MSSAVAQMVKHLSTMWETWVRSLGWEVPWRRKWQPAPVFLPGEFHGQRSLAGYSPWGHKELDMAEQLTHLASFYGTEDCSLWTQDMSIDRLCHAGRIYSWNKLLGRRGALDCCSSIGQLLEETLCWELEPARGDV